MGATRRISGRRIGLVSRQSATRERGVRGPAVDGAARAVESGASAPRARELQTNVASILRTIAAVSTTRVEAAETGDNAMKWITMALAASVSFVSVASAGTTPISSKRAAAKNVAVAPKPVKRSKAPRLKRAIVLKAGDLTGVVKSTRGKPFVNAKIELFDTKGRLIATTKTNANGEYAFKAVKPGQYVAVVDGRTKLRLTMTNAAKVSRLLIIPPAAAAGGAGAAAGAGGLTTWQWVAIGAGAAVVIGGGIAIASGGGGGSSGGGPISP